MTAVDETRHNLYNCDTAYCPAQRVDNKMYVPAQTGAGSLHTPFTLRPSPPQVNILSPSKKNPSLHV